MHISDCTTILAQNFTPFLFCFYLSIQQIVFPIWIVVPVCFIYSYQFAEYSENAFGYCLIYWKKKIGNILPIQNMLPREKASCFELICPLYQYDRNSSGHLVCTIFIAHGIHQQMERKWNFWLAHFGVYSLTSTWEVMSSCEYFVD